MSERATINGSDVLIVVDVQNDFCPGGALAVPRGDEVVPIINRLAARFRNVVLTQDWHPGRTFFLRLDASRQKAVRDHCRVLRSAGAVARPLRARNAGAPNFILRWTFRMPPWCCARAWRATIDSYSAFYENDRTTPTGLTGYLRTRGLSRVFLAGLAFDFCVRYSAEDAQREGFAVFVIEDACRGIDIGRLGGRDARQFGGARRCLHRGAGIDLRVKPQRPAEPNVLVRGLPLGHRVRQCSVAVCNAQKSLTRRQRGETLTKGKHLGRRCVIKRSKRRQACPR